MGLKDYIAKKKSSYDEYKSRKVEQRMDKEKTQTLKSKLDYESMIKEADEAKTKIQQHKKYEAARKQVETLKDYEKQRKRESSIFGKVGRGFESLKQGIDDVSAVNEKMFGHTSDRRSTFGDSSGMFGGGGQSSPFGNMFGSPHQPKKKRSKKKK